MELIIKFLKVMILLMVQMIRNKVIYNPFYAYFLFSEPTIIVFLKAKRWVKRKGR